MLISCVAYQDGKKLADISKEDISEYVARPECFVWVGLKDPEPAELVEMQLEFGLHELAVEDAQHGHQRPKIEEFGNSLFVVLHNPEIAETGLLVGEVDIFVGANYVLSVRNNMQQGFAGVRARCELDPELLRHGSGFVLYALIDAIVDRYFPVIDALEVDLEQIEERIFAGNTMRANIEELYVLKQKLIKLQHAVVPLLEAVSKLYGGRVPHVCIGLQDYFRDIYDHLIRLEQSISSSRELVTTAISVNLSMITLQESQTMKQLAAYAALVAAPTLVAGIYGMNFQNMPELKWAYGYPMALSIMAALDFYLFRRFRKSGWL
ncbi:MAG: magnesium/cobalt transporter CorA [Betaproteobacteria bacterium]